LTITNLNALSVDATAFVLDELYVPTGRAPGEGFFNVMTATATTATTLTGTAAAADASQQTNEWANFQIRITEDTGAPTAVGQRRKITSHTSASPNVYTVPTWTVTPSATCKYVIEGIGDIVVFTTTGAATTNTYAASGWRADGTWSTNATSGGGSLQIPVRPANTATGMCATWAFGFTALDAQKANRYSGVYLLRGGATAIIDCLDLATLSWSTGIGGNDIVYAGKGLTTFTLGTSLAYASATLDGEYFYINQSGTQRFLRFDALRRVLEPYAYLRYPQGTAVLGGKLFTSVFIDGATKLGFLQARRNTGVEMFSVMLQR
jgi:hypothetical protein